MSFTSRRIHDRDDIYRIYCKDPASERLDIRLVIYTEFSREDKKEDSKGDNNNNNDIKDDDSNSSNIKDGDDNSNDSNHKYRDSGELKPPSRQYIKKFVTISQGDSYVLNYYSIIYAVLTYPLDIFWDIPRILKETLKLFYNQKLGIYHRPIPTEGTVAKLEPNYLEL